MRLWDVYYPALPAFISEAMKAPEMRRLQNIGMNCGCEYTSFPLFQNLLEPYSRFDHSVGVALLVWRFTGKLRETLAGLLHDIATPCFAHVVDFMLGDSMTQEATEGGTRTAIEKSETIQALLGKHGLSTDDVADYHKYPIADNDSPRLSADRLEYTLGNLVNYRFITRDRVSWMLDGLTVLHDGNGQDELGFAGMEEAVAFANGAMDMGRIYVSEPDRFSMQMLAELLIRARNAAVITDADLWRDEPYLIGKLCRDKRSADEWQRYRQYRELRHGSGGAVVRAKKRYIDPLVLGYGRLSRVDAAFRDRVDSFLEESQDVPMIGISYDPKVDAFMALQPIFSAINSNMISSSGSLQKEPSCSAPVTRTRSA